MKLQKNSYKDYTWGIVVSLPKPEYWKDKKYEPDLKCVGSFVLSDWSKEHVQTFGRPNPDGSDSLVRCYRTRAEARKVAASLKNLAWTYVAKKFPDADQS